MSEGKCMLCGQGIQPAPEKPSAPKNNGKFDEHFWARAIEGEFSSRAMKYASVEGRGPLLTYRMNSYEWHEMAIDAALAVVRMIRSSIAECGAVVPLSPLAVKQERAPEKTGRLPGEGVVIWCQEDDGCPMELRPVDRVYHDGTFRVSGLGRAFSLDKEGVWWCWPTPGIG